MDTMDPQLLLSMAAFVVAFLFGKHLQAGFAQLRRRSRPAEQPLPRPR